LELERRVLQDEASRLESELLADLEAAAASATEDPADHLFAEDTARGLKLIQMLSRSYDVVVMNPPYGAFVPKVKEFVRHAYKLTYHDIYAAFIDRATMLIEPEGYIGALVSRTFVAQVSARNLREEILLKRNPLIVFLDLGPGILEATVETAAIVMKGSAR
jgi:23S rRNA G2445 N2-methylase RlmL